jgi:hypothetical protein
LLFRSLVSGLVVASGVDVEVSEELSCGGIDDPDVEVLDEQDDACSGVGSADADVAESAVDAQGDAAGLGHGVVADAVVAVGAAVADGGGLGSCLVGGGRGGPVRQGLVRPTSVVLLGEDLEEGLEFGDRLGLLGLGAQPLLEGLLEAFDLAAGGGWFGRLFFWTMSSLRSSCSRWLRPPRPPANRVV